MLTTYSHSKQGANIKAKQSKLMKTYFLLILLVFSVSAGAQKKKKDRRQKDKTDLQLSPAELLKLESMVIEAEKEYILDNPTKATELLKAALAIQPSNAALNFKLAEIFTKRGDSQNALAYGLRAMELDPKNKYYLLLAAEIHKSLSAFDEAANIYQQMIDNIDGTESYLLDLAILYQYQGKYDQALKTYNQAENHFGMNEMVLREKQKIYLREGNFDALLLDWGKLIDENPDNDRYIVELSEFLIANRKFEEARTKLQLLGESPEKIVLSSKLLLMEGHTTEALEVALQAFRLPDIDPTTKVQMLAGFLENAITTEEFDQIKTIARSLAEQYPERYEIQAYAGDVMYRLEEPKEARDFYLSAVSISPSNFNVWQNIVNIEAGLNEYDSVIVHAEQALEYFPNQASLYYFAGTGHLVNQDYKRSLQILDRGKRYATEPHLLTIFYGQMGDAYNGLKQYKDSYDSYEKALEANPDNDHVLNNYSYYLSLRGEQLEKALQMSSRLVNAHPENPTYLDTHGWVHYVLGNFEKAEGFLKKAANLEKNGTIVEHYGDVLFQLGKIDQAVEQWKKAQDLEDASENIEKKIADRKIYE